MHDAGTISTVVPLPSPPPGWFDLNYTVLLDGTLAILRTNFDFHAEHRRWWDRRHKDPSAPRPGAGSSPLRLAVFDGHLEQHALDLPPTSHPLLGRLADGRWLLVYARADEGDANGLVLNPDGSRAGSIILGDAVAHARCAPDNTIWVGYFDEGTYSRQVSRGGIVQFSAEGQPLWAYNDHMAPEWSVGDCYSLTLDGNEVWSCYWGNFPLAHIKNHGVRTWTNSITGVTALAVAGDHVLLAGGYQGHATRLALLHLINGEAKLVREWSATVPSLESARLVQGDGHMLHIVGDGLWATIRVTDALETRYGRPMAGA